MTHDTVAPLSVSGRIRNLANHHQNGPNTTTTTTMSQEPSRKRGLFGIKFKKSKDPRRSSEATQVPPAMKSKDRSVTFALDNDDLEEKENPADRISKRQSTHVSSTRLMRQMKALQEEQKSEHSRDPHVLGVIDKKINRLMNHLSKLEPPEGASSHEAEEFQQLMGIASSAYSYSVARKKERPSYSGIIGARRRIDDQRGLDTRPSIGNSTITTLEPIESQHEIMSFEDESVVESRSFGGRRRTSWEDTTSKDRDDDDDEESRDDVATDTSIANSQDHDRDHHAKHLSNPKPLSRKKGTTFSIPRSAKDTAPRFAYKAKQLGSGNSQQGRIILRSQSDVSSATSNTKYSDGSLMSEVVPRASTYDNSNFRYYFTQDNDAEQTPEQLARSQVRYVKKILRTMDHLQSGKELKKKKNRVQNSETKKKIVTRSMERTEGEELFSEIELRRLKRIWIRNRRRASDQAISGADSAQSISRDAISDQAMSDTNSFQSMNQEAIYDQALSDTNSFQSMNHDAISDQAMNNPHAFQSKNQDTISDQAMNDTNSFQWISQDANTENSPEDIQSMQSGSSGAVSTFMNELWEQTLSNSETSDFKQISSRRNDDSEIVDNAQATRSVRSRHDALAKFMDENEDTNFLGNFDAENEKEIGSSSCQNRNKHSELQPSSSVHSIPLKESVDALNQGWEPFNNSRDPSGVRMNPDIKPVKDPSSFSFGDFAQAWKDTDSPPTKQFSIPSLFDEDAENQVEATEIGSKNDALSKASFSEASELIDFRSENFIETLTKEALADANASKTVIDDVLNTKNDPRQKETYTSDTVGDHGFNAGSSSVPISQGKLGCPAYLLSEKNSRSFDSSDAEQLRLSNFNPASYFQGSLASKHQTGGMMTLPIQEPCGTSDVTCENSDFRQEIQKFVQSPTCDGGYSLPSVVNVENTCSGPDNVSIGASVVSSTLSNKARRSGEFSIDSSIATDPPLREQSTQQIHKDDSPHIGAYITSSPKRSPWKPQQNLHKPTSSYWQNLPQMSKLGSFDSTLVNEETDRYSQPNPYVYRDGAGDCEPTQRNLSEEQFFTPPQQHHVRHQSPPPPQQQQRQRYQSPPKQQQQRRHTNFQYQSPPKQQMQQQQSAPYQSLHQQQTQDRVPHQSLSPQQQQEQHHVQYQSPHQQYRDQHRNQEPRLQREEEPIHPHQSPPPPPMYYTPPQQSVHRNITPLPTLSNTNPHDNTIRMDPPPPPYASSPLWSTASVRSPAEKPKKKKKKTRLSHNKSLLDNDDDDDDDSVDSHRHTISFRTEATDENETFLTEDDRKHPGCSFLCGEFNLTEWIPRFGSS